MTTDPNDCQGCDGTGELTVDGVAFATCDACRGTGRLIGKRSIPSGLGGMDVWAGPETKRDMTLLHDEIRAKRSAERAARRRTGRGTA